MIEYYDNISKLKSYIICSPVYPVLKHWVLSFLVLNSFL